MYVDGQRWMLGDDHGAVPTEVGVVDGGADAAYMRHLRLSEYKTKQVVMPILTGQNRKIDRRCE